jgi:hypothetical protein
MRENDIPSTGHRRREGVFRLDGFYRSTVGKQKRLRGLLSPKEERGEVLYRIPLSGKARNDYCVTPYAFDRRGGSRIDPPTLYALNEW